MMRSVAHVVCVLAVAHVSWAIPIDNGLATDPEVECESDSVQLTITPQNQFEGHIYVKNNFGNGECRQSFDTTPSSLPSLKLPFDGPCGVKRARSLEPRGVFVHVEVVVSFHPRFLTKIDRAYTIQCFYMEADKTVSTDIEVSAITTGVATFNVPMPSCVYQILDAPDGNPVQFATIGQPVYHKWTCDPAGREDIFCMRVHSCVVEDGVSGEAPLQLLTDEGCTRDKFLLGNLEYPTDLMAVKEVHVFKFADRPALQFQCQIEITVKEPGAECPLPTCDEPAGFLPNRQKRAAETRVASPSALGTLDVDTEISTLEIASGVDLELLAQQLLQQAPAPVRNADTVCMTHLSFTVGLSLITLAMLTMSVALMVTRRAKSD